MDLINLAQNRDRSFVYVVMNLRVSLNACNLLTSSELVSV